MNLQEAQTVTAYLDILREFGSMSHKSDMDTSIRGFHTRILVRFNSVAAVMESAPSKLLIMFGGSNDPWDYLADSMALPEEFTNDKVPGKVHAGFSMTWDLLRKKVTMALMAMNPEKDKELVFVGHSLGAALAMLSASELKTSGYKIGKCYLVGCPRAGTKEFTEWFHKEVPYTNLIHGYDLVTTVPLTGMLGYKPLKEAVYLKRGNLIPKPWYRKNILGYLTNGISDHRLNSYLESLHEYVKKCKAV